MPLRFVRVCFLTIRCLFFEASLFLSLRSTFASIHTDVLALLVFKKQNKTQQLYLMNWLPLLNNVSSFSLHREAPLVPSSSPSASTGCLSTALLRLLLPRAMWSLCFQIPWSLFSFFSHLMSQQHMLQLMKFFRKLSLVTLQTSHILLPFLLFHGRFLFLFLLRQQKCIVYSVPPC